MKRKKVCLAAGMIIAALLAGCGNQGTDTQPVKKTAEESAQRGEGQETLKPTQEDKDSAAMKTDGDGGILIAYFAVAENSDMDAASSASVVTVNGETEGRTGHLARLIQEETGGELFSIQTSVDYLGDGGRLVDYAAEEQDENARPELTSHIDNLDQYDVVFVGYPVWWGIAAWPVDSFVEENDFTGKTVIPFCTSASSGLGESGELLKEKAGTGDWQEVMQFSSGVSEEDIRSWVSGLGLD